MNHLRKVESFYTPFLFGYTQLFSGGASDLYHYDIAVLTREEAASVFFWEFILMPLLWAFALVWTAVASPVYLYFAFDNILYRNSGDDGARLTAFLNNALI